MKNRRTGRKTRHDFQAIVPTVTEDLAYGSEPILPPVTREDGAPVCEMPEQITVSLRVSL